MYLCQLTRNEQVVRSSRIVGSIYMRGMIGNSARQLFGLSGRSASSHLEVILRVSKVLANRSR